MSGRKSGTISTGPRPRRSRTKSCKRRNFRLAREIAVAHFTQLDRPANDPRIERGIVVRSLASARDRSISRPIRAISTSKWNGLAMTVSAPATIGEHRPVGIGLAGDQEDRKVAMDRVVANHPRQARSPLVLGIRSSAQDKSIRSAVKLGHRRAARFRPLRRDSRPRRPAWRALRDNCGWAGRSRTRGASARSSLPSASQRSDPCRPRIRPKWLMRP